MTAAELIEALQKHPAHAVVLIWDAYNDESMVLSELEPLMVDSAALKVGNVSRVWDGENSTPAIQLK